MNYKILRLLIPSIFAAILGTTLLVASLHLSIFWPALPVTVANAQSTSLFEYVSPRPNALYVSAGTTIAVRHGEEIDASTLTDTSFAVRGEQSGDHAGRILLADDKRTVIFQPEEPFTPNEVVYVSIESDIRLVTGEYLDALGYSFTISALEREMDPRRQLATAGSQNDRAEGPYTVDSLNAAQLADIGTIYQSENDYKDLSVQAAHANVPNATQRYETVPASFPLITVTVPANGTDDGYLFLTTLLLRPPNPYLLIMDDNGEPVFYRALAPGVRHIDFRRQTESLLSYFDAKDNVYYLLNDSYQIIDSVEAGNGYEIDEHGIQIDEKGHTLLQIYDDQPIDMSQIVAGGSPTATVTGAIVQELDPSGNVIFEWRSWDHIDIRDAVDSIDLTSATPDVTHINSVEWDNEGNIVISNRHLDEVTKIDRHTADIMWRFGGKHNEFIIINDGRDFSHQHDARILPNGNLTLYDNGNTNSPQYSRAVEYRLNEATKTATKVWEYRNKPNDIYGFATGSAQRLPNGNTLIGWGGVGLGAITPVLTEVQPNGTKALEIFLENNQSSYRAFRYPWSGQSIEPATLVLRQEDDRDNLYYSWNGATDVASYNVYGGTSTNPEVLLASKDKVSFETSSQFLSTQEECYFYRVIPILSSGAEGIPSNVVFAGSDGCEQVANVPPPTGSNVSIIEAVFTGTVGTGAEIRIPSNAVSETVTILYTDQLSTTLPLGAASTEQGTEFLWASTVETSVNGALQQSFAFNQPITVTLTYPSELVSNVIEETLRPYRWDKQTRSWAAIGVELISRDPTKNQLVVTLVQSGSFAIFGDVTDGTFSRDTFDLLSNGSFESAAAWTQNSTNLPFVVCDLNCSYDRTNYARSGTQWVTFEGVERAETASISQQFIPPPGTIISATLSVWLQIDQASNSGEDTLTFYLNDAEIATIRDSDSALYPTYTQVTFDVTNSFVGPSQLRIESRLSPNSSTIFRLDDASLKTAMLTRGAKNYLPFISTDANTTELVVGAVEYTTLPGDFPAITVTVPASNTAEGYIFLSTHHRYNIKSKPYLLILDNFGEPVYFQRMTPGRPTHDFKLQPNGLLTYWDTVTQRHHALDETYTEVATYEPANGFKSDFHDFHIWPNGNKLFLIADRVQADLSQLAENGNKEATVEVSVLQEVDANNNVLFEWHSEDHIPFTESWAELTDDFIDYLHTNSIEVDTDGHWIISSRNTGGITKINTQTGEIIWRMGGRSNEFTFINDADAPFQIQHDARRLENGNLLLFDNHTAAFSRAVEYAIDEVEKTATLVWEYRGEEGVRARIMGNSQRLPNGNTLVNFGSASPLITEVQPDGTEAFQLTFAEDIYTYRAFRFPWVGRPTTVPKLIVESDAADATLRYSWNGATEVAAYAIYGDKSDAPSTLLRIEPKSGFETTTRLSGMGDGSYKFRVMPLDAEGNQLVDDVQRLEVVGTD